MCSPVLMSLMYSYLLVFWFDILQAIAKLNRASPCIAANSEYFEVSMMSIVMMLLTELHHALQLTVNILKSL